MMYKLLNNSPYFDFVIKMLYESLTSFNVSCEIVTQIDFEDYENTYIVCTTHENHYLPNKYVSYQMEQLTVNRANPLSFFFFDRLRRAEFVLDYSLENIKYLKEHYRITAHHLPLGYHDSLAIPSYEGIDTTQNPLARKVPIDLQISQSTTPSDPIPLNPSIDKKYLFVFYGAINERRSKLIEKVKLIMYKYINKLYFSNNCFGNDKNELILNTRAALNFHFYEGKTILEVHRIIELVANKVLVYSERSNDAFYDRSLATCVNWINESNMETQLHSLRQMSNNEYESISNSRLDFIKNNFKYIDFVSKVLHLFENVN